MSQPAASVLEAADDAQQYLTFRVGQELYAMSTDCVREIIEYAQVTPVPMMPRLLRGVINLRGAVVPVVDLGERFGSGQTALGSRSCIVIVELGDAEQPQLLGALVEAVSAVQHIEEGALRPAPAFGHSLRSDFVQGMVRVEDGFITLLQIEQVLSVDELAALAGQRTPLAATSLTRA